MQSIARMDHCWRHSVINTRNSWLHGDPRGFRSRKHLIHSSGDYHNPPPAGEHAGLHRWMKNRAGAAVAIPSDCRADVGRALLDFFRHEKLLVRALAVAAMHAHLLVELPEDEALVRRIIGEAKRDASRRVTDRLPGALWSAGGAHRRLFTVDHLANVYPYILLEQGAEAWTWSHVDQSDEGMFARRPDQI